MGSEDTYDCCGKAENWLYERRFDTRMRRGPEKKRILDEFLESTGFHRNHATRLLNDILRGERPRRESRGRVRRYGPAVQAALVAAWRTVNYVCGKTGRSVSAGADPDHGASRASVIVR